MNNSSNITLELTQEFKDRRINPTFHTNLVWPYIKNNDILFPKRDTKVYYDFGNDEDQEWLIKEMSAQKWTNNDLELQVKWTVGDVTWGPLSPCKDLEALDICISRAMRCQSTPRLVAMWTSSELIGHTPWHTWIYAVMAYVTQLKRFSTKWLDNNHQGFLWTTMPVHSSVL